MSPKKAKGQKKAGEINVEAYDSKSEPDAKILLINNMR